MTGPEPKGKPQISVSLTPEQVKRVVKVAEKTGASRNSAMRYIVEKGLKLVERELGLSSD